MIRKLINKNKTLTYIVIILLGVAIIAKGAIYFYNTQYKNYYLTVVAPINQRDGMGRQAIDLITLLKNDVEMNVIHSMMINVPQKIKEILKIKNKKPGYVVLNEHSLLQVNISEEDYSKKWLRSEKYKYRNLFNNIPREEQIFINYSMFEADMLPEDAVYNLNKSWDMIVVPDQYLVDIYVNSGVTKPIFVIPLGVDLTDHLKAPLKTERNKIFKFANFSVFEERKNIMTLIKAYHQAFKGNDQVRLLLSSRGDRGKIRQKVIDYILENNVHGVEIDAMEGKDTDYFNFLYSRIDCYVSPSKGEGFSIIPRETMARGIPTIVSDSIAQKTLADTGLVKVVNATKPVPGNYVFIDRIIGNFFDIEISDLSDAMLDVYNNYQQYLNLSQEARKWAAERQSQSLKEEYLNMVKPKKIILGDRNEITKEHLMTNSKELYNKFMNLKSKGY